MGNPQRPEIVTVGIHRAPQSAITPRSPFPVKSFHPGISKTFVVKSNKCYLFSYLCQTIPSPQSPTNPPDIHPTNQPLQLLRSECDDGRVEAHLRIRNCEGVFP